MISRWQVLTLVCTAVLASNVACGGAKETRPYPTTVMKQFEHPTVSGSDPRLGDATLAVEDEDYELASRPSPTVSDLSRLALGNEPTPGGVAVGDEAAGRRDQNTDAHVDGTPVADKTPSMIVLRQPSGWTSAALTEVVLRRLLDEPGIYGVAVKHLISGEMALLNADRQFEAASLYKLAVMFEVFKRWREGTLAFSDIVTVSEEAVTHYGDGEPTLPVGSTLTISEALERMISASDNTSGHVLLELLEAWRINQTMRGIGLEQTEILYGVRTSPRDVVRLLELMATGQAIDVVASQQMIDLLLRQQIRDRLPRLLPPDVLVANKTGNWIGVRHDVGIVYGASGPYIIAVLAEELEDDEHGSTVIAEISRLVYDYFNP